MRGGPQVSRNAGLSPASFYSMVIKKQQARRRRYFTTHEAVIALRDCKILNPC
jgi:hypothetical protein